MGLAALVLCTCRQGIKGERLLKRTMAAAVPWAVVSAAQATKDAQSLQVP